MFIIENRYYQKDENLKYAQSHYSHTTNKFVPVDYPTVNTGLSILGICIFKSICQLYI